MEIKKKDYDDVGLEDTSSGKPTIEEVREYLTDTLFEVCEDWVLRGTQPGLKYVED